MRITDLLKKESIQLNASPKSKSEAIDMLVELQVNGGCISDKDEYKKGIIAREEHGSTAVGEGIAIPHTKNKGVKAPSLAAMTVPEGVDYEALDDEPSDLLFMIAAPEGGGDIHLDVLAKLMTILMDEDFRANLLAAKDKDEFLKIIDDMETKKYPEETPDAPEADTAKPADGTIKVLAVTACPTGIAHTYMAAEALEKAGRKLGISIKVETNGSGGAKNILTKKEIEECDGIIVAADKTVEMGRFDGKKVIKTKVSDGIKIPEELINRIEAGDAPVYHHTGAKNESDSGDNESFGRKLYKADGKLFVINGGISKAYQQATGIAGYTLIYDSHSLSLAEHKPFDRENSGEAPVIRVVEKLTSRANISDTDKGAQLSEQISDLHELLAAYRNGTIKERG